MDNTYKRARMRKNIDVLAPGYESSWTFYIAGKARKISEVLNEILDITEKVFVVTDDFFIPKKIDYSLLTFPENYSANQVFDHNPIGVYGGKIQSQDRIYYKDFIDDIRYLKTPEDLVRVIRQISIDGKTKFILRGREDYIDNGSPLDIYSNFDYEGKMLDDPFRRNPVWIQIHHDYMMGEDSYVGNCETAYYRVVFWTETDVWFEKTDIGRANRNNFRVAIKKFYNTFDVSGTFFMSDWFSKEDLKDVVFGND